MSSAKIQVVTKGEYTQVLVDNKFAYTSFLQVKYEMEHLQKLIDLLAIDNVEVINKEKV